MSSGFNTDVPRGERVFHVQTEDRGPQYLSIDTVVYQNGRILRRKSTSYADFASGSGFSPEALGERVENQHREVIEALRAGALDAEIAAAEEKAARAAGIEVRLLNPKAWLAAGKVALEVEVLRRSNNQPVGGATVEAWIDGALRQDHHSATADESGRARIEFELPPLGQCDLALVIQAKWDVSKDELRFAMRSRGKSPSASPAS